MQKRPGNTQNRLIDKRDWQLLEGRGIAALGGLAKKVQELIKKKKQKKTVIPGWFVAVTTLVNHCSYTVFSIWRIIKTQLKVIG